MKSIAGYRSSFRFDPQPDGLSVGGQARVGCSTAGDVAVLTVMGICTGLAYQFNSAWVEIPAGLVLVLLTWRRLDLALALVVLLAPFFMAPKHLGSKEFAPSELLLALDTGIALLWALSPLRRDRFNLSALRTSPFLLPAGVLLVAAAISTALAAERHLALRAFSLVILEPLIFFALVTMLVTTVERWRLYLLSLVAAGAVVGVIALFQFVTQQHQFLTSAPGAVVPRVRALYGSPDNLGLLYDRVLPVWFAFVLAPFLAIRRRAYAVVGAILLLTLFLTNSRGAWLAIAAACLAILSVAFPRRRWIPVLVVILVLAGAALKGPAVLSALQSGHTGTVQQRLYIWGSSLRMIGDYPLVGIGPDNFQHYYAPKDQLYIQCTHGLGYMNSRASREPCLSHPHDEILDFWLSTGILGLAAFLWAQVVFWRRATSALRSRTGAAYVSLLGVSGAMVAADLHGLVDNSYFLVDLSLLFWLLCAAMTVLGRDEEVGTAMARTRRAGAPGGPA